MIFLENPFGDSLQGKLLTQMQGMMAEYERAQINERTRWGKIEKSRKGEYIPWAYSCYGYSYIAKRYGSSPEVIINDAEAKVIQQMFAWLVDEQLSCRQITKRLNQQGVATPSGKNVVWQPASVRSILTSKVYVGQARYNYRQAAMPKYRRTEAAKLKQLKTGRSYRPEQEWIYSPCPAILSEELFNKAQLQLQRNAEKAARNYQPSTKRYLLRHLIKCGECGLAMVCTLQKSVCKKYEYLYYCCKVVLQKS